MDCSSLKIHFSYCVGILVAIIVIVATDRWSSSESFTTYLSNAATMTSLLLAVVAIFYSFISNDSLSRSLGSISKVSDDVREAKGEIASFVSATKSTHESNVAVSQTMVSSSAEIKMSLSSLDSTLDEISQQNRDLRTLLADIPNKIEKLETTVSDATKQMTSAKPEKSTGTTAQGLSGRFIDRFIAASPLAGNLLSYAAVLAYRENKILSISEFADASESPKIVSYLNGFLTCMHSMDILDFKQVEGSPRTYRINRINSTLSSNIKDYFTSYVSETLSVEEAASWLSRLKAVEALFLQPKQDS